MVIEFNCYEMIRVGSMVKLIDFHLSNLNFMPMTSTQVVDDIKKIIRHR